MSRDGAVTAQGVRSRGIVMVRDREALRAAARKHTRLVNFLKLALPGSAFAIAGLYSLSLVTTLGLSANMPTLKMPKIMPENLAMKNPHYEGYNKDGGKYWVKAEKARQDLKNFNLIKLEGITGELTDVNKRKTVLKAARGIFNNKANVLELYEAIDVAGDGGMAAHLTRATVKTKEGIITSNRPVVVEMQSGRVTADKMTARQKSKEYTFVDNVKTHFKGRDGAAAAVENANALIGQSDGPVDVASNRLDIDDAKKVAIFSGGVTALQAGATLKAPELEVHYDGGGDDEKATKGASKKKVAGGTAANTDASVTRMIAKGPVNITQANGDTLTSRSADFDPVAKRALFDGDVVMLQKPDKRVTADVADLDQVANTVLLTGDVGVAQGGNLLKGRRLLYSRQTNVMQLTAPGPTAAGGRITARFLQKGGGKAGEQKTSSKANPQGIAFGATFKTDPNAPVDIEAARLDVNDGEKRAVFTGDVRAVQGDFILKAAQVTAIYSGSAALSGAGGAAANQPAAQLSRILAKRKVEVTSKDGQKATGDWAEFDPKANTAVLGGNVVLTQGENIVRGTKLQIDMNTGESVIKTEAVSSRANPSVSADGTATAESTPSQRPSAVFFPGRLKAQSNNGKKKSVDGWQTQSQP